MAHKLSMNSSLLCSICNKLLKDPRGTPCYHFFCAACLKEILDKLEEPPEKKTHIESADSKATSILFRCPQPECGNEFPVPDASLDAFPVVTAILPLLKKEEVRQSRTVCSKHKKSCKFFCKKCTKELCQKCLKEHEGHGWTDSDEANKEFIEKCRERNRENEKKFQSSEEITQKFEGLLNSEESKLVQNIESSLNLFGASKELIAESEIESLSKSLQEFEFRSPQKESARRQRSTWPFRAANRVLSSALKAPSGKAIESVRALELAQFYLQEADKALVTTEPKMKANLSNDLQIAGKFCKEVCEKLAKICKPKSTGFIYSILFLVMIYFHLL